MVVPYYGLRTNKTLQLLEVQSMSATVAVEEKLTKALNERGYIVFVGWGKLAEARIGEIVRITMDGVAVDQPFVVIGETDREDWNQHRQCIDTSPCGEQPNRSDFRYWRAITD